MSYVVLARKWRPMRFEDLVGQEHVSRTLGNAIKAGRVAHAFLFTGVRGVGKTTSARILAKALNCLGDPETTPPGTDPGPTITPCLKCAACTEIAAGSDVDVWEIDGASYNGVDEVRKLQDSLPYRPQRDRYKVYIVDEVHMLSQNAWNAFLKTLEEPPPHVKFIFATTEVHKVPVTILSRVQRFDFKLISAQVIANRLRYVLGEEKVQADDATLSLIAREAAGSMRDAMSLLDQVIAWGGEELRGDEVARVLGVASRSVLFQIAGALTAGDAERCLRVVADLTEQGYDLAHAARDLLAILRDLVVAKVCADPGSLLDLPDQEVKEVFELARGASNDDLLRLHQGFSAGFDEVVKSGQPRAALEMLLVRLARRPPLLPIDDLIGRLSTLERRLSGGNAGATRERAPAARAEAPAPAVSARPRENRSAGASEPSVAPNGRDEPPETWDIPDPASFAPAPSRAPAPAPSVLPAPRVATDVAPPPPPKPTPKKANGDYEFSIPDDLYDPAQPAPKRAAPANPAPRPVVRVNPADHEFSIPDDLYDPSEPTQPFPKRVAPVNPAPTPRPTAKAKADEHQFIVPDDLRDPLPSAEGQNGGARAVKTPAVRPAPPPLVSLVTADALVAWRAIVDRVAGERAELAAFLARSAPLEVAAGSIRIAFGATEPFVSQVEQALLVIERAASEHYGTATKLSIEPDAKRAEGIATIASLDLEEEERLRRVALAKVKNHPRVADAVEVLGARLKELKLAER